MQLKYWLIGLSVFCIRPAVSGASVGDAIIVAAVAGLAGLWLHLESKKVQQISKQASDDADLRAEISEIKSAVNALKISRAFGK